MLVGDIFLKWKWMIIKWDNYLTYEKCMYFKIFLNKWRENLFIKVETFKVASQTLNKILKFLIVNIIIAKK